MRSEAWGPRARRRIVAVAAALSAAWLLAAAGACATPVTVGSPLTAPFFSTLTCGSGLGCMYANTTLAEPGANVASPVSGRVVRWRLAGNYGGDFLLRVLRPAGGGQYIAAGSTVPVNATGTTTVAFAANLPIQAGDLIGVVYESGRHLATATAPGSAFSYWSPPAGEVTGAAPSSSSPGLEVLFNADVQPQPQIASLSPSHGPTAGGTPVVIAGSDLDEASSVSFGATTAASFTVDSPSRITVISPPGPAGAVDVAVTTTGGTTAAGAADRFTYANEPAAKKCVVPKLKAKRLKAARRALSHADCRLGKVRGRRSRTAVVKKQSPKPGTVLPAGAEVNVRVGPRSR
jgi:hypothetical protein